MLKYWRNGKCYIEKKTNEHSERWSKSERNGQPIGDVYFKLEQRKEAA